MELIVFLITFPLLIAGLLLFLRRDFWRNLLVIGASLLLTIGSILLTINNFQGNIQFFNLESNLLENIMFGVELLLGLVIIFLSVKHRRPFVALLGIVQTGLVYWFERTIASGAIAEHSLYVDKFALIMAVIIGLIGGLICIYSLGYMKEFHEKHHPELPDNRPFFFFIIFLFLSAMYGIIFANDLRWFFCFWEITTLASFLLIGYKQNTESINNSFRALFYNLIGGLGFILGLIYLYHFYSIVELDKLLALNHWEVLIPVLFFCFAGLTKSAQLPFSSWLLGAMVAPTPVSALLHSSTMVKAGVYLIIKLAPVLQGSIAGVTLALVGGVTFLFASLIAISQSDAKKVLAYSTIANLGLIVLCAGIGTAEAVWAAILLVIFHAIAKALLFLCVGRVEHSIHSRDIEEMDSLIVSMPKSAWLMLTGMAGMFLAPFGMLISKWAVLKALLDANPLLSVLLVYGSSATLFFWVKWMGKLLSVIQSKEVLEAKKLESGVSKTEWSALFTLGFLTIGACLFFPLLSNMLIEPYVTSLYGHVTTMGRGNIFTMLIMMGMVILFPFSLPGRGARPNTRLVDPYLAGTNVPGQFAFIGSLGVHHDVSFKNYYMEKYFGEKRIYKIGATLALLLIIGMFIGAIL